MASLFPGYNNAYATAFGTANFWVVTSLHFDLDVPTAAGQMLITLSGFATVADANNRVQPMGTYSFALGAPQVQALFGGAQSLVQAALLASNLSWAGATFSPAGS